MRRNVHKYENDNIAVPNNTDEMFETLYAHETLYHHHAERRNTCAVDPPLGGR